MSHYIDTTYMPGGITGVQRGIPTTQRRRRRAPAPQAGGLKLKDVANGISKAYNWVKTNKPLGKINAFLDANVPAQYKTNPVFNAIKQGIAAGAQSGFGVTQKPKRRRRKARK